jgi:hypothetical protein
VIVFPAMASPAKHGDRLTSTNIVLNYQRY